jgi:prepilin-type N-terminal cleavage/methylation domain-containing protein
MNRPATRGYTAVELLMAVAVFAIGVSGIIALQKVTVVSNQHAKNLAIATQIAQSWVSQLTADAALWNNPSPVSATDDVQTDPQWLSQVDAQKGAWFEPGFDPVRQFGPAFDALGNVVSDLTLKQQIQFCTHLRLTQLYPSDTGGGLIRAEVRVFWFRNGEESQGFCTGAGNPTAIGQAITTYHFVYQTTAITQQTLS